MPRDSELIAEARIAAPRSAVWAVLASVRRYAEWVVNTLEVTRADSDAADPGVTYDERNRIVGPWHATSSWRVVSADAPRHAVHVGTGIAVVKWMRLEMTLEDDGADGTRYRHALSYEPALGPAGPVLDALLRPSLRRDMHATTHRLRALVEREAGAAGA